MQSTRKSVQCLSPTGLHTMSYKEWGDANNPNVLVCVHGLARVSDDFDVLAASLCEEYRVVCPDVVGRGSSGHLRNPMHYQIPQYVSDMVTLLARLEVDTVDWFGTSMGGLIGMGIASLEGNPIRKLLLNDVGPALNPVALSRIGEYVGQAVAFERFDEALTYIKSISQPFGAHTDAQWEKLARDVLRKNDAGQWIKHYDLGLCQPFKATTPEQVVAGEAMLWAAYDAIKSKTLVVRGKDSDLLSSETATEMTRRGPCASLVQIPHVGHAPTFVSVEQIAIARDFFLNN